MGNLGAGGMRSPLFEEDYPEPQWTTLAKAPWVARRRQGSQTPRKAETPPWVHIDNAQEGSEARPVAVSLKLVKAPPWIHFDDTPVVANVNLVKAKPPPWAY